MDVNAELQSDLVERRRLQNRLAQRKFRGESLPSDHIFMALKKNELAEKKRRAARNSLSSKTQSPNGPVQIRSAPQADTSTGDPVVSATAMPLSLDELVNEVEEQGLAETSLEFQAVGQLVNQETHNNTTSLPDIVAFQPDLLHSSLQDEITSWDPTSWDIPQTSLSHHNDNNILDSNEKQPGSRSLQRRNSDSDLLPPLNDDSLPGLLTFSKQKGWISALHIAAQRGHEQIIQVLLQSGNMDVNQQDSDGRTPLLHAVMQNRELVVRLLLKQGARIGILDCDGRSGIHWAVLRRNLSMLQLLLKHREEYEPMLAIDSYDNTGWTALHMAIVRGFEPAMLLLMKLGADINAKAHKCPFQKK
jgi:hypothetical protein